jgi:cytochrome P450
MNGAGNLRVPDYIPKNLIYDYDFFASVTGVERPHWTVTEKLKTEAPPVFYTPRNGGHWVVTSAEVALDMFRHYDRFSIEPQHNAARKKDARFLPLEYDPPEHTELRKIVAPIFTPASVARLEPGIRELAVELIEGVLQDGGCEFVKQISNRFPVTVFLRLANGPIEHADAMIDMANRFLREQDFAVKQSGVNDLTAFLKSIVDQRRANPGTDLISDVVRGRRADGTPLTEKEILGACTFIFMAGLDTVAAMIAFIMEFLARNPGHYKQLTDDPSKIGPAVEELMRVSGVAMPERGVARDNDYNGIPFRKGDRITFLLQISGMNDPRVENPYTVDFDRDVSSHLVFGSGAHRCLGSHLARVEIRVFLEEWVKRIPKFRLGADKIPVHGGTVWIPQALPLVWDRPAKAA